jgi:hypothetical protein
MIKDTGLSQAVCDKFPACSHVSGALEVTHQTTTIKLALKYRQPDEEADYNRHVRFSSVPSRNTDTVS